MHNSFSLTLCFLVPIIILFGAVPRNHTTGLAGTISRLGIKQVELVDCNLFLGPIQEFGLMLVSQRRQELVEDLQETVVLDFVLLSPPLGRIRISLARVSELVHLGGKFSILQYLSYPTPP